MSLNTFAPREEVLLAACTKITSGQNTAQNILKQAKPWATLLFDAKESPRLYPDLQEHVRVVSVRLAQAAGADPKSVHAAMVASWRSDLVGSQLVAFDTVAPFFAQLGVASLKEAQRIRDAELGGDPVPTGGDAANAKRAVLDRARIIARNRILGHLGTGFGSLAISDLRLPLDLSGQAYGRCDEITVEKVIDEAAASSNGVILSGLYVNNAAHKAARSVCSDWTTFEDHLQSAAMKLLKSTYWGQFAMAENQIKGQLKIAVSQAEKTAHRRRGSVMVLTDTGLLNSEHDPGNKYDALVSDDFSDTLVDAVAASEVVATVFADIAANASFHDTNKTEVKSARLAAVLADFAEVDLTRLFSDDQVRMTDEKRVRAGVGVCVDRVAAGDTKQAKSQLVEEAMQALLESFKRARGEW